MKYSTPTIESVITSTMAFDAAASIDTVLLDANPATAIRPAGILNGDHGDAAHRRRRPGCVRF